MKGCKKCEYVYDNDEYIFCPYCGEKIIIVDSLRDLIKGVDNET